MTQFFAPLHVALACAWPGPALVAAITWTRPPPFSPSSEPCAYAFAQFAPARERSEVVASKA
ncbi:hypothetical protein GCM10023321_70230 [Pseudonocardia eucalypti]|uniref:Secreted protein n=1 Tax=Pseudonocardia eucalypti TaxID=648755 RepID=A0ABP9R481_9PSEU